MPVVRPSTNGYGLGVTQDSSPAPPDGTFKFSFRYDPDSSAPFFVSSPVSPSIAGETSSKDRSAHECNGSVVTLQMDSRFVGFRAKYTTDLGPGLTRFVS